MKNAPARHIHLSMLQLAIFLLAACSERHYLSDDDAGAFDAGAPDAGAPDAGAPDAGPFILRDGGSLDARVPWHIVPGSSDPRACPGEVPEAMTGDHCIANISWPTCFGGSYTYCGPEERLVVADIDHHACTTGAPETWTDCAAALAGGEAGQPCSGSWRCIEPDAESPCCVEVAECNPPGLREIFNDLLVRTTLCGRPCTVEPYPDRPTRTECPSAFVAGDTQVLNGDTCTGVWACLAEHRTLGIQYPPAFLDEGVPVWCDGEFLRISGTTVSYTELPLVRRCPVESP
jgi:hypothetical protein